jgi:hypothetical protein
MNQSMTLASKAIRVPTVVCAVQVVRIAICARFTRCGAGILPLDQRCRSLQTSITGRELCWLPVMIAGNVEIGEGKEPRTK